MKKLRSLLICLIFSFLVCAGSRPFYCQSSRPTIYFCDENPFDDVNNVD